jgi:hypothetical protein
MKNATEVFSPAVPVCLGLHICLCLRVLTSTIEATRSVKALIQDLQQAL